MIKILSGWSNPGGSTVAFIRLCNLFNDRGLECEFYGPHEWHLKKCKSGKIESFVSDAEDILISHMLLPSKSILKKRHILSLHETNLFPLKQIAKDPGLDIWDAIHYVSNSQRAFHSVNKEYMVIPNIVEPIKSYGHPASANKVAGVIGSIDSHKQTHLSIQRALDEGFEKVKLFGNVTDIPYSVEQKEWLYHPKVEMMGHCDDQAKMYDQVAKVFHSSKKETFNYIKAECGVIGKDYNGLESSESGAEVWGKDRIFEAWKKLLHC